MINATELRVFMTRKNNMTISELASQIGKSPATITRWLEKKDMPVKYAEKLISILEIPQEQAFHIFFSSFVAYQETKYKS